MLFNFFLGNHDAGGLKAMPDLLLPIYHGLAEAGHRVIGYARTLLPLPAVNVLVEFFPDDVFVDQLVATKARAGDKFVFGVICTEDLEDALVMEDPTCPGRRRNLLRLLGVADFVWTLLPQVPAYEAIAGPGKAALLEYGFSERFLNPQLVTRPELRDIDVTMYGSATPYRAPIVDELERRGFNCFTTARHVWPEFATTDALSRSKIVLDLRRGLAVRFPSPTRVCKAVHGGAMVVAERLAASPLDGLYAYTVTCSYAELADRCDEILRSGRYVESGLAALAKFRAETSMRRNMEALLKLPFFERVAAQKS
jgi:hypothetical protein